MEKLLEQVRMELERIAESGLNGSNIDRAYKLVDMLDNLRDAKYREIKTNWLKDDMGRSHGYDDGYNRGYERDNSYNRDDKYARYINSKKEYRHSQTADCKRDLMSKLDDYMDQFTAEMENMLKDADCQEERDTINRYISKIKNF